MIIILPKVPKLTKIVIIIAFTLMFNFLGNTIKPCIVSAT